MKKLFFLSCCLVLSLSTFAQKKKNASKKAPSKAVAVDSTNLLNKNIIKPGIQQVEDFVEGSLQAKDLTASQDGQKRFYDAYKILLHEGEELMLEHNSSAFRVMLGFKHPNKQKQTEFSYDANPFSGNSSNKFHFTAPSTGVYTLLATSMDAGQIGKYSLKKTVYAPNVMEAQVDAALAQNFKALLTSKKDGFKSILGEKIKKDKKDKALDKAVGQERYNAKAELITGKTGLILVENGGTANYKSIVFESEQEAEAQGYFENLKKQLQILTRNWLEQPGNDKLFSASTDQDIVSLTLSSVEDKKKKKSTWQVIFTLN